MRLVLRFFFVGCLLGLAVLARPARAANLTTTNVQAGGTDWTAAIWKTNGTGTAVSPMAGNTYEAVFNATSIGNGTANTRIRNPAAAGLQTFPGNSLMLDTNTELRAKGVGAILNFPGVGGNPGLIVNGGMLNGGDDATFVVTGRVQVVTQSYISHGAAGGGGGISPLRAFNFTGVLSGSGNVVILNAGTTVAQQVSGSSNTFSGRWIVQCGWLLGTTTNSLGTNSITVDRLYTGYLAAMPNFVASSGVALFEAGYDLNSAGRLILTNGGVMSLHQNCIFSSVIIEGVTLSAGTHSYLELVTNFPSNFASGGSGSLTVQPYGPPPTFVPIIVTQPQSATLYTGDSTQFVATASGTIPLSYQWQKRTNSVFGNLADAAGRSGSKTNMLSFSLLMLSDAGDYRLIVTNLVGAATSQVATLTVLLPGTNHPAVATLSPQAGATVNSLTQLLVTFSRSVIGVEAQDLQINGTPAGAVSGSGSNYVFTFTQPPPGTVLVNWDADSAITDLAGNPFDTTGAWGYTLIDNIPPAILSTAPAPGATVKGLTQAQVLFSEPVTGVEAADLLLNGVPAVSAAGSGFGPYSFQFAQPAQGTVRFTWAAGHNIRDLSANLFPGAGWTALLDSAAASAALTNVVINEFLAANINTTGLTDEDGDLSDWIELYNRGNVSVNLTGWSLTDTADQPAQWTFPATNIAAGQYLVVFASGKDRRIPGANLHTSFSLNAAGEYLGLYNGDYPPLVVHEYAPQYPAQVNDISCGLDSANALRYFAVQTPGGPNSSSTLVGVVAPVHFTVGRGVFNQPFTLLLTVATPGASIRYTTDSSPPTESSALYTNPFVINRTTTLRAAAFGPNLLPSAVQTHTYIFPDDVLSQPANPPGFPTTTQWSTYGWLSDYGMDPNIVTNPPANATIKSDLLSLPALSLVMRTDDMFGSDNGLYTHPDNLTNEAPCSVELINPDGSTGFQCDAGIRMHGGGSRVRTLKHPFRLVFKGQYGATKLDYPFFPDSPVNQFDTIVLRSDYNNHWTHGYDPNQRARGGLVRDAFVKDAQVAMGAMSSHSRYVHLYINGLYWGVYNPCERPDSTFAASYLGGDKSQYDAINGTGGQLVDGDTDARNALLSLNTTNLASLAQYAQIQEYLDVPQYIDYMIAQLYGANWDWGTLKNWYAIRLRQPGAGFKYLSWDSERVFEGVADKVNVSPDNLQANLVRNAEYRLAFADHVQKHFFDGGALTTNAVVALWQARAAQIDRAIVGESARWGDSVPGGKTSLTPLPYPAYTTNTPYTREENWLGEQGRLFSSYFPFRSGVVLTQFMQAGLYPSVAAPRFSPLGGRVPLASSLTMTPTNATIYYTTDGSDPRVYGVGTPSPNSRIYSNPLPLLSNVVVKARVLGGAGWSALEEADFTVTGMGIPIRFTELMYDPIGGDAYEFIELQNLGATAVNLSGYSLDGVTYVFPDGTTLAQGGVIVLSSSAAFATRYPGVIVAGSYQGTLANGGQRIALLDRNGSTVTSVTYNNAAGWPTGAAGGGYSLEVINPNGDPNDPANWRASLALNGSPGVANPATAVPAVCFNEIMAENAGTVSNGGTYPDWLELYNSGSNAVGLANWSLSNSGKARKYVFPAGTSIPSGGYLVVWCDSQTVAPGLHSGFTLGRKGENLFLYDSLTNRVDAFSFGLQLTNYTVGRVGPNGAWQLTLPTLGSNNVAAALGPATSLIVNEWLANSAPGGSDWLELYNSSASLPVALSGLYLATSNELFQIRSQSFIAPRGFVQLFADKQAGFDHLDFKLSAAGDVISLYDPTGLFIDGVSFINQAEGVSAGKLPDGSANIVSFPGTASPGASNYVNSYNGPILNELMARNVSAVYDARGKNPDWLELYNPSAASYSLAGMSLSTDPGSPGQWVFPAGASIGADSYLIVWCDGSRPASTNLEAQLNAGFPLSGDGAAVYLFNTNNQVADSVAFGFQVADLSMGRSGGTWSLLSRPTPGAANASPVPLGDPANLRLNEWMANPVSGNDWFELYNAGSSPVSLAGLYLTDDPSIAGTTQFQVPALSFIASHGWAKFEADSHRSQGPNHVNFSLDKDGQTLRLYNTNLALLDSVEFGLQANGVSQGRLPDGGSNIVSFPTTPTPGESNYLPLQNVVVNEVLSHTDPPLEDAIELYNPTGNDFPLGGWFISNSETDFKKYRIPAGTVLPAGGYLVFYEYQFNSTNAVPFTLNSAHGDSVLVSEADDLGNLTGYRTQVSFGAAENGVSFGRFVTSAGVDFVPLASRSFGVDNPSTVAQFRTGTGLTNSYPKVGPLVINEIMYHPITGSGTNAFENTDEEYVELFNITPNAVPLYDPAAGTNHWKLSGAVDFLFPAAVTLPAAGYALVVGFDPATNVASLANFRSKYGVPTNVSLYGPYSGKLNNAGASIQLYKPDSPQTSPHPDAGFVPYALVEQVTYSNAPPWPAGADGTGMSLQRRLLGSYGNEPLNWVACSPNPGTRNCMSDTDGDGLPDDWELANGLNPYSAAGNDGANGDPDGDGFTNLQEYLAGTDPHDPASFLKIDSIGLLPGVAALCFTRIASHSYSIQYRTSVETGSWQKLADVESAPMTAAVQVNDLSAGGATSRFYRLVTPKQP
jgi:CotH kinase protein/Lamin Tail Domain/Fn3 associated/Chitobiase/beta-hexosaminidase C-terminal domain/Immunoglobulin I-set domain/Bacterial TSP3 repeat